MAGLFASMAMKWALDSLSSLLPAAAPMAQVSSSATAGRQQSLEDLQMLGRTMSRIHAMLHDAEQHWDIREESAKLRLKELKNLAYDAEDVVEEYEYEVNRCRVEALEGSGAILQDHGGGGGKRKRQEVQDQHAPGVVPVPVDLAIQARKLIERFTEIKDYSDAFSLSENDGERRIIPDISSVRQTSSFVFAPRVIGREQDKGKVIEKLMSEEGSSAISSPMSVLAIVGMGGLGKTTLAKLVYNDTRVCQFFDLCGWVCVLEHFDVVKVTREIISSLTQSSCDHIQSGALPGALVNLVKEKKVFLVLDDVWNERSDYWEMLCLPMLACSRCDIVVTTRNDAVARLVQTMPSYNLSCLSPHESWSLFKQTAFVQQETDTPANLVDIGKSITDKCMGLPLAIKTLGSTLRFETDEMKWIDVLESELWDLDQSQNEIFPALELSYKYMPLHLKRCFVSLSLYPKGFYLDEGRVILLWKTLGLLQYYDVSHNKDEIGSSYVKELVQRSLLQSYPQRQLVIHDLVHDLACFLAGEEFFRLEGDKPCEIPRNARYVSILPQGNNSIQVSSASESLRAIIMLGGNANLENPEALFLNCKKFRIIDIQQGRLARTLLHQFIGSMKLLRHFRLTGGHEEAAVIPNSIFDLFNLRVLSFGQDIVLHRIGRLVNLYTLPDMYLSKCSCFYNIRVLRNLNKIRTLRIYGLCNVSIEDANEAQLQGKRNIEILALNFHTWETCVHKPKADANQGITEVSCGRLLENLRPHNQKLRVLELRNFNCAIHPSWLGNASFSMLTEILLENSPAQHLPTLGELPSLKSLDIRGMEHVEHIGREFCSLHPRITGFPSLVELKFSDMNRLSEWHGLENGEFPRLRTLWISSTLELRSLPWVPFSSLLNFELSGSRNLVTVPASAILRELSIANCPNLKELPALPSLRSIKLFHCPSLVAFSHFPSLTVLCLEGPFKEEIFYRLVNSHLSLEELTVWSDTILSIHLEPQSLPSLMQLGLHCRNLQYCYGLGDLTSLKRLYVTLSPQLQVPNSLRSQLEEFVDGKSW